ncbi:MAG: trypsin-like peptidase domain-containing protein [Bacteroidota bacterium]
MFTQAIEKAGDFTRPIHTIVRTYGGHKIVPGAATLFFVNRQGYAITCKHVVEMLVTSDKLTLQYNKFRAERAQLPNDGKYRRNLKGLEQKYKFTPDSEVQMRVMFVDCVDTMSGFTWFLHPTYDLAILKFNDYQELRYSQHAIFKKNTAEITPGKFLCRLGFPFPEFTNYQYNQTLDEIEWTTTGINISPRFPIEGMLTRFLADQNKAYGIEMSTPGLRGQSGGPLFDTNGLVYGMQFSTKHLHLGFDIDEQEFVINNRIKKISDHPFIHLGQCIHVDTIKEFLTQNHVTFHEE